MNYSRWAPAAWVAITAAAVLLVTQTPKEQQLMGQMPPLAGTARDLRPVQLPQELPGERTLAVLVFDPQQRAEARSWIDGMGLRGNATLPWVKVRVVHGIEAVPASVAAIPFPPPTRHVRDRWVSVSTDADALVHALGFPDKDHALLVVMDRQGKVLARAQGAYDAARASALLDTLLGD